MKVFGTQSYNLHSLSLHHSQKEQNCLKKNKAFILPLSTLKRKEGKKRKKLVKFLTVRLPKEPRESVQHSQGV